VFRNLLNLITLNEPYFFKTPEHFRILSENVVPEIIERKEFKEKTIKVWNAGCSTGEETYSIVITLLEALESLKGWRIEVLASDVSQNALNIAQTGEYTKNSIKNLKKEYLDKYFDIQNNRYRVKDFIKEFIKFKYINLVHEPFPIEEVAEQDIIFCRNVTIHFKIESTRRVISRFYDSLCDIGYLFIGPHETLLGITNELRPIEIDHTSLYCKGPSLLLSRIPSKLVIATIYLNQKKFEFAKNILTDLMTRDPDNPEHHILLGMVFKQEGKLTDAVEQLQRAINLNPQILFACLQLADTYEAAGNKSAAATYYERTLEIARNRPAFTPIEVVNRISKTDIINLAEKGQQRVSGL
ncbi:MAG: CheR family methyltransferase, partial [candidate division WOR-3 bacterium]